MKYYTLTIENLVYNTRQVITGFKSYEEAFAYFDMYYDESFECTIE